MNRKILILLSIIFLISNLYSAKKVEVFTADNIIQLIKGKIATVKNFVGVFTYKINNKTYYGEIKFKYPNKFLMNYYMKTSGDNYDIYQKIVSNGKNLWLVFKDQNIAISEILERDKDTPLVGWNINRLVKEYYPVLPKTGYKVLYGNINAYRIEFTPKSSTAGFKYINMIVSENGDILKIEAQNQVGTSIEMSIKYTAFNIGISDDEFDYEPDENTQIYENILLPKE